MGKSKGRGAAGCMQYALVVVTALGAPSQHPLISRTGGSRESILHAPGAPSVSSDRRGWSGVHQQHIFRYSAHSKQACPQTPTPPLARGLGMRAPPYFQRDLRGHQKVYSTHTSTLIFHTHHCAPLKVCAMLEGTPCKCLPWQHPHHQPCLEGHIHAHTRGRREDAEGGGASLAAPAIVGERERGPLDKELPDHATPARVEDRGKAAFVRRSCQPSKIASRVCDVLVL